jgi:ATP-dependent Lon protease
MLLKSKSKKWDENQNISKKELSKNAPNESTSPDLGSKKLFRAVLDLPWNEFSKDNFDLKRAQKILTEIISARRC